MYSNGYDTLKFALSDIDMRYIQIGLKRYQCAILKNTTIAIPTRDTVSSILVSQYIFVTSFNYQV